MFCFLSPSVEPGVAASVETTVKHLAVAGSGL